MPLATNQVQRVAAFELNALRASEVFGEEMDKLAVPAKGTPVYDVNGTLLFMRMPLARGRTQAGYADIAVEEAMGEPLLATTIGASWVESALVEEGSAAARKGRRALKFDATRFVAYSYPKLALQFLLNGAEVLMLELYTWAEIAPAAVAGRNKLEPANFERWSLLDELPDAVKKSRTAGFRKRLTVWEAPALAKLNPKAVAIDTLRVKDFVLNLNDRREVHYSASDGDHSPCYELRAQQTNVWCVGASTEMLLLFYRYTYNQVRLATELGLGTMANPNGLPYSRVGDVVTVIERLTNLNATMHTNPGWDVFRNEIRANRPLISFVPGHSRTVAGYTRSLITAVNQIPFRGLLVYDPWPPPSANNAGGKITKWENFNTQTYQYAYSAVIEQV